MKLIEALGLDYRILIAQLVNFGILVFVLYKLGYKPIIKFVQERTSKIEQGIEDAKQAEAKLNQATADHEAIVTKAHHEAQIMIQQAKEAAEQQATIVADQKKAELMRMIEKAKADIATERERALRETKNQAVEIVLLATEKLIKEKVDSAADKVYLEKVVAEMK